MIEIDDAETWALIESSVEHLLTQFGGERTRLADKLESLGWAELEAAYPVASLEMLARHHGTTLADTDLLDRTVLAELRPAIESPCTAVLFPLPGNGTDPSSTERQLSGLLLGEVHPEDRIAVPVISSTGIRIAVVAAEALEIRPVTTFDRSLRWFVATGTIEDSEMNSKDATGLWSLAVEAGQRTLSTQVLAAADQCMALVHEQVSARSQFGHRLSSFQVVRHRLADARAELDGARSLLQLSWTYGGRPSARVAKISVGHAQRQAASTAIQLCGAVGLTNEHRLHRYVSRATQLDSLLGTVGRLESELGDELFDPAERGRPLPELVTAF